MTGTETLFWTKDGYGNLFQMEVNVLVWKFGQEERKVEVSAFIPASDNVNATHLALLSMQQQDYWPDIQQLILMDNGSARSYNLDLMLRFCRMRGEGTVIRVGQNVDHKGAFDLLGSLEFVQGEYLLSLDSDVEFLKHGLVQAMKDDLLQKEAYCTGTVVPDRTFTSQGMCAEWSVREWCSNESVLSSCCLWKGDIWRELIKEVGAGAYWIPEQGKFYDGTSRMHERAVEKGYKNSSFAFEDYVKHYGCVTWARRKANPAYKEYDNRYIQISDRLKQLGGTGLQEDEWTGGGWAGVNIESQDFTVSEQNKEDEGGENVRPIVD